MYFMFGVGSIFDYDDQSHVGLEHKASSSRREKGFVAGSQEDDENISGN